MPKKKKISAKKPLFKNHKMLIALSLFLVMGVLVFTSYSSAQTQIVEYKIIDIGSVDCWTDSSGEWVRQTAWDGTKILTKPNTTVSYKFRIPIPSEYRSKVFKVDVEPFTGSVSKYNNADQKPFSFEHYQSNYRDHAVQNVTVTHSHNDDNYIYFNANVTLVANVRPKDVREEWQAPLVQGWKYYVPTHITLTAEVEKHFEGQNDTLIVKNMLQHSDGHEELLFTFNFGEMPVAERYYKVEPHLTNPYISPRVSLMDKNNVNVERIIYDYGEHSSSQ